MIKVRLDKFNIGDYYPGSLFKRSAWYLTSLVFFKNSIPFPSSLKAALLRNFGAKIGKNLIIKPCVNIKYPWFLQIGNNCWIGEDVWIDNLAVVKIENNVCLSQGSFLLTGSHNYKISTFDLIIGNIILEDGVWIGAKSIVCPNVTCKLESVLAAGSVATHDLEENNIYQGNPATKKRKRN